MSADADRDLTAEEKQELADKMPTAGVPPEEPTIPFLKFTPEDFISYIDSLFLKQKKRILSHNLIGKPEAFDMEYMQASAAMNRVLRVMGQDITREEGESDASLHERSALRSKYVWAYAYWWNRTHLLEALAKSRSGNLGNKKNIAKGADTLRKLISGEKTEKDLHPQFKNLINNLKQMNSEATLPNSED